MLMCAVVWHWLPAPLATPCNRRTCARMTQSPLSRQKFAASGALTQNLAGLTNNSRTMQKSYGVFTGYCVLWWSRSASHPSGVASLLQNHSSSIRWPEFNSGVLRRPPIMIFVSHNTCINF